MSCVPDCVKEKLWHEVAMGSLLGAFSMGMVVMILIYFQKHDKQLQIERNARNIGMLFGVGMVGGCVIFLQEIGNPLGIAKGMLMLVYLTLCSITDLYMQQVYDSVQLYVCVTLAIMTFGSSMSPSLGGELIVFGLIQVFLFRRMYGDGDVMGFLICALSLAEEGIFIYLLHMGLTYLFLGIIQGIKGNIGKDGNLKVPVPLFPYLACTYAFVF